MKTFNQLVLLSSATLARPQDWGTPLQPVRTGSVLVGDGNPHQAYLYKQVTDGNDCNGTGDKQGCSTADTHSETYTIGFSAGISGAGWISGGFDVSQSTSTGQADTCNGGSTDTVCTWKRIAHTAYTVQDYRYSGDDISAGTKSGDPYIIWSPNSNEIGNGHVCGHNSDCGNIGDEWWGSKGPAGGPQKYPDGAPAWL